MKKIPILFLVFVLTGMLTVSCDDGMVYHSFKTIEKSSWSWGEPAVFNAEITDTIHPHDILVQVRHSTDYPLSNLYMFVHVDGPSGQQMTDTINFILAEKSGKWIGKGIGNLREIGYLYKKNILFPEKGEYQVILEQAMRLEEVPVSEVGVRIMNTNH